MGLSIVALIIPWVAVICSTATACRCRCVACGCGPCCSRGAECKVANSIAWGLSPGAYRLALIVSATGLWIVQLILVRSARWECEWQASMCTDSYYARSSYSSYGDCNGTAYYPPFGLGTGAALAAALGVLLSIPAVLLSEHAIQEKQQRNLTIAVVMAGGGVTTVTGAPTGMAPMTV